MEKTLSGVADGVKVVSLESRSHNKTKENSLDKYYDEKHRHTYKV